MDKHHIIALLESVEICIDLLCKLPDADIVLTTLDILATHANILVDISQQKHYGDNNLDDFIGYIKSLRYDLSTMD